MTIIFKPGNPEEHTFKCVFCGCEFGTDEFTINYSFSHAYYNEWLSVPCPYCGQTVKSFRRKFYD